jgi:hypothetical protein
MITKKKFECKHNDERPPDRIPMFQLVLREQGPVVQNSG